MESKRSRKIVAIGGVAAGPKAASRARRRDANAEITIIEKGEFMSYAGCGLPYYIADLVKEARDLMCTPVGVVRDAAFFRSVKDVHVLTRTLAESIDREAKEVAVVSMETGERWRIPYDKLVLATGGSPVPVRFEGGDLNRIFRLNNPMDAVNIREAIASGEVKNVAIIGGGLIGVEVTEALALRGMRVTIIELLDQILPGALDPEIAAFLTKHLKAKGVDVRTGERVLRLEGDDEGNLSKVVTDRGEVAAEMVLLAIGVRPNVTLAQQAGLALGPTGAIAVDEHLRTSDPDIYAGGDCVENTHLVSRAKVFVPMGSTANKHGRIIGDNVTGGEERFPGVLGTAVLKAFDFNVGRTGLTENAARQLGYDVVTAIAPSPDCAHYYPTNKTVVAKLIVDRSSRRVLGLQALGPGESVKRIDVVATALAGKATIDDIANLDLGYAPPYATAIDVVAHAANILRNKLAGLARGLTPMEVKEKLDSGRDFILLDVRTPKEYEAERIDDPRVRLIPLGKLRERMGELPKDAEIVTFCKISLRGYEAQTVLDGAGFTNVSFMDGGLATWPYATAKA